MKKTIWVGNTRKRVREFPDKARRTAGEQIWRVQNGIDPEDWKPMPSIGAGAKEIRIHQPHEHRVVYVASYPEGLYILHAFEKKTQQTPQRELERAKANYAEIQRQREK